MDRVKWSGKIVARVTLEVVFEELPNDEYLERLIDTAREEGTPVVGTLEIRTPSTIDLLKRF